MLNAKYSLCAMVTLAALKAKAMRLGATDFGRSARAGKRFFVIYGGKIINFGSDVGHTYIDHHDMQKRKAWRARHTAIVNGAGQHVYLLKTSPSYWSTNLLW